jgi:hypothetical protein
VLVTACDPAEELREVFTEPPTPHEAYSESLRDAGLEGTALGSAWLGAAARAIAEPVPVTLPYREAVYVPASEARAFGFRVALQEGQILSVLVEREAREPVRVFLDVFDPARDTTESPRQRASADSGGSTLTVEARSADTVHVRIQPELLRDVRLTITLEARGALAFPVSGKDTRDTLLGRTCWSGSCRCRLPAQVRHPRGRHMTVRPAPKRLLGRPLQGATS